MTSKFKRPRTNQELNSLELEGLWKGIGFSRRIAEGDEKITLDIILKIHKVIFQYAIPEIAGRFRKNGEDITKLKYIEPSAGRLVQEKMYVFARELDVRFAKISRHPNQKSKKQKQKWYDDVFHLASWVQHQITAIHPFCEGNGRMARLMTNVILRRFGIHASRVKIEGEDKKNYLSALGQIDLYDDYGPLKRIIIQSAIDTQKQEEKQRRNKKKEK